MSSTGWPARRSMRAAASAAMASGHAAPAPLVRELVHSSCHLPCIPFECPQNQFDSIDLSDNTIARLDGFPKLMRLKVLLLNNNRVSKIARGLEGACTGA